MQNQRWITVLLAAVAAPAFAVDHPVHVGGSGLTFTPSSVDVLVGDTVTFINDGGFHNAASDPGAPISFHCSAGCGASPVGDPNGSAWTATVTITAAAAHRTIGYHCDAHQASGMVGTINVTDPVELQSFRID